MNTVAEIADALPKLDSDELSKVGALLAVYRQQRTGIIYDDAYGLWTEQDQVGAADQAFLLMDAGETTQDKPRKP